MPGTSPGLRGREQVAHKNGPPLRHPYYIKTLNRFSMIHARDVRKEFDSFVALQGLDVDIEDNGIFGIIGHNGAGKTTFLKICAGLLTPTSGTLDLISVFLITRCHNQ